MNFENLHTKSNAFIKIKFQLHTTVYTEQYCKIKLHNSTPSWKMANVYSQHWKPIHDQSQCATQVMSSTSPNYKRSRSVYNTGCGLHSLQDWILGHSRVDRQGFVTQSGNRRLLISSNYTHKQHLCSDWLSVLWHRFMKYVASNSLTTSQIH